MENLIYPTLTLVTIGIIGFIVRQNSNKFFRLGFSRAKKAIKSFYPLLQKKVELNNPEHQISFLKDEIYTLLAKPRMIATAEVELTDLNNKLNSLNAQKRVLVQEMKEQKKEKEQVIRLRLERKLSELAPTQKENNAKKEKLLDDILLLEDRIKAKEDALFNKAMLKEENPTNPEIMCKSEQVLNALSQWFTRFYNLLKQDALLLIPIAMLVILVAVDYYVGTSFVIEQYKGSLFQARGAEKLILNVKIYSMAFMVFGVVLLMIEFTNKKLFDIYKNHFVQGVKWLFNSLIVGFTFLGVVMYLGATRFFEGNLALQSRLEDTGLILIWFGLVFVCSVLFNEIKNSKRGFSPLITMLESFLAPLVIVSLITFTALWALEYSLKVILNSFNKFLPQSRALELSVKRYKKNVEHCKESIKALDLNHSLVVARVTQDTESELEKIELEYSKKNQTLDESFLIKHNQITKVINEINNTELMFREGSDQAVVTLWGKYIF